MSPFSSHSSTFCSRITPHNGSATLTLPFQLYLVSNRPLTPLFISIISEQVKTFQETTTSFIFNYTAYHIQVPLHYLIRGCPARSPPGCVTRPAATFAHSSCTIRSIKSFKKLGIPLTVICTRAAHKIAHSNGYDTFPQKTGNPRSIYVNNIRLWLPTDVIGKNINQR